MGPVLVSGGSGQLGSQLRSLLQTQGRTVVAPTSKELDLSRPTDLRPWLQKEAWSMVLNAGAWTAVDLAEDEPQMASLINEASPRILAQLTRTLGIPFLHVSTDYVFADWKGERRPLREEDLPCPKGIYALTKWKGEQAVLEENPDALVVRTSGVYHQGGKNFVGAILRRLAQGASAQVVDDQFTLPSPANFLAEKCLKAMDLGLHGILNIVPSGQTSWYETARVIAREFEKKTGQTTKISPIQTKDLNQKAPRPSWSILSNQKAEQALGESFASWEDLLVKALQSWPVEVHHV